MKTHFFKHSAMGLVFTSALCASAVNSQAADADHLVLSELSSGGRGEYIEIYNPTTSTVALGDYYVSDDANWSDLPKGPQSGGTTDMFLKFPDGATLQPGQVAVVVSDSTVFLDNYYRGDRSNFDALPFAPQLFEVTDTNSSSADDMISGASANPLNYSLTNPSNSNGEFLVLFHWNGTDDLVKSCDIIQWGNPSGSNSYTPLTTSKTGANGATYNAEAGGPANLTVTTALNELHYVRLTIDETGETLTGGNGITGHDESTEDNSVTWAANLSSALDPSPGVAYLGLTNENRPPVIESVERDIQYPTSADTITLTANNVTDSDGTIADVTFYTNTDGSETFTPHVATAAGAGTYTAAIGSFANDTIVHYYAVATDDDGTTVARPGGAASSYRSFIVTDTPLQAGDIVINEIVANDPGGIDAETIELYNTTNRAIDISNFRIADNNDGFPEFPEGTIIAPFGYVVLALDAEDVRTQYPSIPLNVPVVDWGDFGLNNEGDDIKLVSPNDFFYNGDITGYVDQVIFTDEAPWPTPSAGQSIELINPTRDNSDGNNWALSTDPEQATLGRLNSAFVPNANVNDWNLY